MVFDLVEELLFQGALRAHEITPLGESQIQSYRLHLLFRTSNGVPLRIVHYLLLSVDPNSPPSKEHRLIRQAYAQVWLFFLHRRVVPFPMFFWWRRRDSHSRPV